MDKTTTLKKQIKQKTESIVGLPMIRLCPRCHKGYMGYSDISKRDNKTEICPSCKQEEDFIDVEMLEKTLLEIQFLTILAINEKIKR